MPYFESTFLISGANFALSSCDTYAIYLCLSVMPNYYIHYTIIISRSQPLLAEKIKEIGIVSKRLNRTRFKPASPYLSNDILVPGILPSGLSFDGVTHLLVIGFYHPLLVAINDTSHYSFFFLAGFLPRPLFQTK